MRYQYVSPGRYRDTQTNKIINSTTDPNRKPGANTPAPGAGGNNAAGQGNRQQQTILNRKDNMKTVRGAVEAERKVADYERDQNLTINNPNQYNPFGNQTVTMGPDGRPTVRTEFSQPQQQILEGDQSLSIGGRRIANNLMGSSGFDSAFNPQLAQRWSSGSLEADRSRIEDEAYNRLTRNVGEDEAREKEEAIQTLANRGVNVNNPEDPTYKAFMRDIERKYTTIRGNARQDAVAMGGQEYERAFGIGEQMRANDLSQSKTIRDQRIGELGAFGSLGTGLQVPNFQGFTGATYDLNNPTQINDSLKSIQAAFEQLRRQGGGGGGSGSGAQSTSAFNSSPPPGL